ncbi:MAG TPA: biosynthetic peptidoglycan transglycosylase [Bacteroidales bacterium]|nr:biosynthetic peptidoglycan transglycosylase [Bacteroidales bacterium]
MSRRRVLFTGIVLFMVALMLLRGPLLRVVVSHKIRSIEKRYSLVVNYDRLTFKSLSTVMIDNLSLTEINRDTLFSTRHISLSLNPFKLLLLTPDLRKLEADNIKFNFIKQGSTSNFDFLFRETKTGKRDTLTVFSPAVKRSYARTTDRLFSLLMDIIPSKANIKDLTINYINKDYRLNISTPLLKVDQNNFTAEIENLENGKPGYLYADGVLDHSKRMVSLRLFSRDKKKFSIPFIDYRWGAKAQFDTLAFEVTESQKRGDFVTFKGNARAKGILVNHKRLSSENVNLKKGTLTYSINIGNRFFELDSCSVVTVNNFSFSPYLKITKDDNWRITASLNKKNFEANDLFSSLPSGLFYNLDGLKTSGEMSYHFLLDIDFSNIDSLRLESSLTGKNFRIIEFGNTDFRRINDEFEYTAYEKGMPVRTFMVGPSNSNFRNLERISPYLQTTVLQSEDGGFFYHRGFLPGSIREALVQDLKEKRFHRGGSSISMQLVKNIFLSRNKTLARKFEEMMIVWLIENNHLCSKERMFEVYLNIIEWGPGVYGANEAARFYFDKDARDINVNEAIFLSSIIPAPKWSLNSFDDNLQLKPSLEGYYKLLAQRLRIKGLITESEEVNIMPEVHLKGEAKRLVKARRIE